MCNSCLYYNTVLAWILWYPEVCVRYQNVILYLSKSENIFSRICDSEKNFKLTKIWIFCRDVWYMVRENDLKTYSEHTARHPILVPPLCQILVPPNSFDWAPLVIKTLSKNFDLWACRGTLCQSPMLVYLYQGKKERMFQVVDFNEVQAVFGSLAQAIGFASSGQDASPDAYVVDADGVVVFRQ